MVGRLRLLSRLVGFGVAVTVAVAATQLLAHGFEAAPLLSVDAVRSVGDWIRRPPRVGAGILAGIGLWIVGLGAVVGTLWPRRGPAAITTRRRRGWTRIDRRSLAASIQRELEGLDRRNDLTTRVSRSGRVDVAIKTVDVAVDGPGTEIRAALDELCARRGLPCRSGTITIKPRRPNAKRKHTIR